MSTKELTEEKGAIIEEKGVDIGERRAEHRGYSEVIIGRIGEKSEEHQGDSEVIDYHTNQQGIHSR